VRKKHYPALSELLLFGLIITGWELTLEKMLDHPPTKTEFCKKGQAAWQLTSPHSLLKVGSFFHLIVLTHTLTQPKTFSCISARKMVAYIS